MTITVFHRRPKQLPHTRAIYAATGGSYDGWTGSGWFGVIWPFRYFGWRVTCWATVMEEFYGNAHAEVFFGSFDAAAGELERLMDKAESMGEFARVFTGKPDRTNDMTWNPAERAGYRQGNGRQILLRDRLAIKNITSPLYYRRFFAAHKRGDRAPFPREWMRKGKWPGILLHPGSAVDVSA